MVFTRAHFDTLSREILVEELIKCSKVAAQIKILLFYGLESHYSF